MQQVGSYACSAHVLLSECTAVLLASPLPARRRYARGACFSFLVKGGSTRDHASFVQVLLTKVLRRSTSRAPPRLSAFCR